MGCMGSKQSKANGAGEGSTKGPGAPAGKLFDKYTLGKVLGQGAFGVVYLMKKKGTKEEYAVKMIDKVETPLEEIKQEAEMLQRLAHPCIVKLHEVYYEKAFVCMVMEVYRGGDMIEGMQAHWKTHGMIPMSVVANVGKQMIAGIAWLHQNKVVHRDVKGDNYLMDRKDIENPKCRIFLSDFGTVCEVKGEERLTAKCGTKTYWAPEFFLRNYSLKVDVWAIGVVMFGLVTGRFPFKGEEDVKHKKITIPSRSSPECADLLKKLLERKEPSRITADEALAHPFIAGPQDGAAAPEKMDFSPDVRESGANAGVAERRRELVGRLEEAADQPAAGARRTWSARPTARISLKELRGKGNFEVTYKQAERTARFEWWALERARKGGLMDSPSAFSGATSEEAGEEDLRQTLNNHGIDTDSFGKGQAKRLEEFVVEVQSGSSHLMLDATKQKSIVRVVDVVLLRVMYKAKDGKRFLIQSSETFPDGRVRSDINQLPGTKKEPHENAMETARRIMEERLQLTDGKTRFDFTNREYFEEDEESPSYPGVRTVYRKEIYEGQITTTDPKVLKRICVSGGGKLNSQDSKGYTRTFEWLTEKQCQERKIKMKVTQESGDISALVHPPIGIGEEDLKTFLESNSVDVSRFGEGTNKSLKDFSDELVKGEAALTRRPDGKVIRVVDVVILKISRGTEVLVETDEVVRGGKNTLNRLPAVKRRPDENMFLAAHRVLTKVLKVNENFVSLSPKDVLIFEEEKQSAAYCGLPTVYRKRIISAELLTDCSSTII